MFPDAIVRGALLVPVQTFVVHVMLLSAHERAQTHGLYSRLTDHDKYVRRI